MAGIVRNHSGNGLLRFCERHGSEDEGLTVGFDACHALAIKRTPSTLPFLASNGEITTTNNAGLFDCRARSFDFLGVPGIELKLAQGTIGLDEFH